MDLSSSPSSVRRDFDRKKASRPVTRVSAREEARASQAPAKRALRNPGDHLTRRRRHRRRRGEFDRANDDGSFQRRHGMHDRIAK